MAEKNKKDVAKWRVAIVGIGFVIGVALLFFGGGDGENQEEKTNLAEDYRASVELSLKNLCESAAGCDVEVFVSLDGGFSYTYALDSRGGVVTVGSGSSEKALVEAEYMPSISGVGAVYSGADDPTTQKKLIDLISSSLGIGKNKIFIIASKKSNLQS